MKINCYPNMVTSKFTCEIKQALHTDTTYKVECMIRKATDVVVDADGFIYDGDGAGSVALLCAAAPGPLDGARLACCERAVRRLRPTRALCRRRTLAQRGARG